MNLKKITGKNISFKNKWRFIFAIFICLTIILFFYTYPDLGANGTIKIWDRNNILLYETSSNVGSKIPVVYEKFPKDLINATVSLEDDTFWTNQGVDFKSILRSLYLNFKAGRIVSGASTITQQLARQTLVLGRENLLQSLVRKSREVVMALRINFSYAKKDILTMYLNRVYYGNLAYGANAASRIYFNKDVSKLSLAESAYLTGLLSSPIDRDPFANPKIAKKRQEQVLDLMVKHGYLTSERASKIKLEKINLLHQSISIKAPHFVNYVLDEITNIDTKQGVNVYTTLDYSSYLLSQRVANIWVDRLSQKHQLSNASLVLIKNDTGEILNMLGGVDYFDSKNQGQVNMTTALRQPGSALKPVTYAAAFMQGFTPATLIFDVAKVYKTKKGEGYTPNNYDGKFHGLVLIRESLASSLNLPAVEMLARIGIPKFLEIARKLGITTLNQEGRYDLSLTLGGGEVKLLDLTNSYASFARGGVYKDAYAINKITSDKGKILYQHDLSQDSQVLGKNGEQVAYLISNILSDKKARLIEFYEKNPLVLSRPAAAKTGTTTDWHDNWTVGYTPSYTVGVWVGNNDNRPMKEITGIVGAAPIWNQFFEEFLKDKPVEDFIKPKGLSTVSICKLDGLLTSNLCQFTIDEIFISGTEPKQQSSIYKKVKIDTRNNLLAGENCPAEVTTEKIMVDYPAQVYSFAVLNNQDAMPKQYSPLCENKNNVSTQSLIEIIYPKAKTIFEDAPDLVNNQGIVFEANVSADIVKVEWYLNKKLIKSVWGFPFSATWYPKKGKYVLGANALTNQGKIIKSTEVIFSVTSYQEVN